MPMVLSKVYNDWNKHWECLLFISLEDVEEVVILEEAHSSISHLEMDTSDTLYDSLEESWDEVVNFVNFAYFQDFLKFG